MKYLTATLILIGLFVSCTSVADPPERLEKIALAKKKEGDVYQSQGKYTAALARLLEAEHLSPEDPYIQNSLGLAYMGKKRDDLAAAAFAKALSLKPEFTEAKNNLGAAYLRQEKWDTAISTFHEVLEDLIYPTPQFPLANTGWAYLGKGNFADARRFFLKALDEQPDFITAHHGIARVFLGTGQINRSIEYVRAQLRKTPRAAILHADLADAYETDGRPGQAITAWQMVRKLSPRNSALFRKAQKKLRDLKGE